MADEPPVITIERAAEFDGQVVTLDAWLHNLRRSGKLLFPIFRDGTGFMQGVAKPEKCRAAQIARKRFKEVGPAGGFVKPAS